MEIRSHLDTLHREGSLLAAHAARAGLDAPVPSCPDWTVRDLVRHTGGVHRWAAAHVRERRTTRMPRAEKAAYTSGHPAADAALLPWYEEGLAALHDVLARTLADDPGVDLWTFLPAPTPLAFWARRQAHETAVHRADAALAADEDFTFAADVAADGIGEMLGGFLHRMADLRTADGRTRTLVVDPDDAPGSWLVRIGPDGATAEHHPHAEALDPGLKPDCRAGGRAAPLYLALWNRLPFPEESVHGDPEVLGLWRANAVVFWSV